MRHPNTIHHYRIPAVLALITVAGMLAFAAAMTVSAQSNDPDWRQAPTGLSVTTGNEAGKLDINWDTSSQDTKTLSDYRVTWTPDGEAFKHWGETDWNAFPTTNELTLTGLNAGETYQVKVRARYDDNKRSKWSDIVTAQSGVTPNAAATGQPIISGTAQVRQTLTAGTSSIADDNGLTNVVFSHQWLRNSDDADTDVSGATAETYVLGTDDLEHSIKVRVSFTDDDGYTETVTSKATAVVVVPPNVAPTGLPTITGTAEEGETLNADTSDIADDNGLTNVAFSHQWVRSADETDTDIADATGSTYIVTSADAGSAISVRASFTDDDGYLETVTSKATASVPENTSKQPPVIVPPEEPQIARATHDGVTPVAPAPNWTLKPAELAPGDQFRIIFLSSTTRDASSTAIADYNTFVQNLAAAGHADIRAYSSGFRVVGCTADTDALDNTDTTYTSTDKGVPIYWLGGAKVADDYADFYDGSWEDEANAKDESGNNRSHTENSVHSPFTGCENDGTEAILQSSSRALGAANVRVGPFATSGHNHSATSTRPMYGLSQVFRVVYRVDLGTLRNGNKDTSGVLTSPDLPERYQFTLTDHKDVQISVFDQETDDAVPELVDSDGYTQKQADSVGARTNRIMWTILGPGTHYIKISQKATGDNSFDLRVRVRNSPLSNDDYSADILTTGAITLGDYAEGTIAGSSQRDDNDWFAVELPVLSTYEFKATPSGPTPSRSLFVILRDSHGQALDSGSRVHHKTEQMGKHFVEVRGSNGDYTISVSVFHRDSSTIPENEDLPVDIGTTGYIQINGAPATGYLTDLDSDQFAFRLQARKTYQFDLHQKEAANGQTLAGQTILLLGRRGEILFPAPAQTDVTKISGSINQGIGDTNSGEGDNSRIRAAIHRSGIYFIRAENAYADSPGGYSLYATDVTPDDGTPPRRGLKATQSEPSNQDLPNFITSDGYVRVNDANGATGNIKNGEDEDVFKVQLEARTAYQIEVWGENGSEDGGTLADPEVRLRNWLFDNLTNATFVEQTNTSTAKQSAYGGISDADGGLGQNSLIPIAVYQTGTYYIQVGSEGTEIGTYTVYVKEISWEPRVRPGYTRPGLPPGSSYAATSSEGIDDLTQDTATKGNVEPIGTRAHGRISTNRDVDYFKIVLVSGYSYRIDVKGDEASALGGTLSDPHVELRDSNGNALSESSSEILLVSGDDTDSSKVADDDSGEGSNALLRVKINSTARYYIAVTGASNATGTYTVQATIIGQQGLFPPQGSRQTVSEATGKDLPKTIETTGYVQPNGAHATGTIRIDNDNDVDTDYFKVDLVEGQSYQIDCKGNEPRDPGGTLDIPRCVLLGNNAEFLIATTDVEATNLDQTGVLGISDATSGEGDNARIKINVYTSGTYHIAVADADADALSATGGTYTLVVNRTH